MVATAFALLALQFPNDENVTPANTSISFIRDLPLDFMVFGTVVGIILYVIWICLLTVGASNAVNVTDGLDGLAGGASILAIGSFVIIGFWQFNQSCFSENLNPSDAYRCYDVRDPLDIAIVATAIVGGAHRIPLVEHEPRAHLHGRHRLARARRRPRRPRDREPHRAAPAPHRRPLRHRDRLGHPAAGVLQAHAAASASS